MNAATEVRGRGLARQVLGSVLPARYYASLAGSCRRSVSRVSNFGLARFCPLCRSPMRRFLPFGVRSRPDALCPVCKSVERHRALWLYLSRCTDLLGGTPRRLLHVAPELPLARRLRSAGLQYTSIDLSSRKAMLRMDVTRLAFADESFDVILCNHVLEHVPDDRQALAELYRVLRPGGWAIVQVPIKGDATDEDLTVTSAAERERRFGQSDHVRQYGRDYEARLRASKFAVEVVPFAASLPDRLQRRYGLIRHDEWADEDLRVCWKE